MKSYIYAILLALAFLLGGCQSTRSQAETAATTSSEPIIPKDTIAVPLGSSADRLDDAVRQIVGQIPATTDIQDAVKK
jgi:hypothetical protein